MSVVLDTICLDSSDRRVVRNDIKHAPDEIRSTVGAISLVIRPINVATDDIRADLGHFRAVIDAIQITIRARRIEKSHRKVPVGEM